MFQLFSISKSWGKNVHWTFQLFPISGVGLIQSPRLTSSILFKGAGLKTSPEPTSSLLFKGTGLKTSTGRSNSSPFLGVGLIQSLRLPAFLISSAGLKTSPGRFYSSTKLLKTSSIMFHSSSESSGIGCNSPSVPSSFSMNE
ncbi:Uncharacterised protein [Streptococcus pneumoniae]|nr:Uncharacterised protein [Streptococcus pneumoniae]CVN30907.1 Uncharacterised protein [Streptococcus pneumoniae]CVP91085.1 Uncharacterised protein [Streptococcus pneumoniae]CVR24383.1 Uncharacterised protein [Streptococcus pneumoniae]CVV89384.1 Uncharacterised protein [Streptococcus pneumoniae]